jgi:anti-sigma factor RsiW
MTTITRDIVADLWPLYVDGTLSPASRALVEQYVRDDPEWAESLQRAGAAQASAPLPTPPIEPDGEARVLNRIKRLVSTLRWTLLLALVFSAQAFGRIVADTTWTGSPRSFIIMAACAAILWIAFFVTLGRLRPFMALRPR